MTKCRACGDIVLERVVGIRDEEGCWLRVGIEKSH